MLNLKSVAHNYHLWNIFYIPTSSVKKKSNGVRFDRNSKDKHCQNDQMIGNL